MDASVRRLASGSPYEPVIGYSRAVVAGPWVLVAGTTGTVEGRVVGEGDAYAQTVQAFRNVEAALASAGATLADVVQTRMFVTDIARWKEVGRAHRELFGDIRPVTAMLGVAALIDPAMLVEVEAVAWLER
ncbi:MAG TPA: RidA family protein [Acidimicrobiales bacterium]|jgi:enamine deaminase RidA (YjgF/YER057c/UK114 family)|nr:RidA family protein [Acidimicrobiales bacterium]